MEKEITIDKLETGKYYKNDRDILFKLDHIGKVDRYGFVEVEASEILEIVILDNCKSISYKVSDELCTHQSETFKEINETLFRELVMLHTDYCDKINSLTIDLMDIK